MSPEPSHKEETMDPKLSVVFLLVALCWDRFSTPWFGILLDCKRKLGFRWWSPCHVWVLMQFVPIISVRFRAASDSPHWPGCLSFVFSRFLGSVSLHVKESLLHDNHHYMLNVLLSLTLISPGALSQSLGKENCVQQLVSSYVWGQCWYMSSSLASHFCLSYWFLFSTLVQWVFIRNLRTILSIGDFVGAHIMKEEATKSLLWSPFLGVSKSPCFGQAHCPVHKGRRGRSTFQEWLTLCLRNALQSSEREKLSEILHPMKSPRGPSQMFGYWPHPFLF